jgi:methyl-accepting chemotaxis protein-1 (serine sensor receptor)
MFANLSVKARLFLTLGLLSLILVVVGLLGLRALARSNDELQSVFHGNLLPITWVGTMSANSREVITKLDEAIVSGSPADLTASQELAKLKAVENNALWEKYKATQLDEEEKRLAQDCEDTRKAYRAARDEVIKELAAGNVEAARTKRGTNLKARIAEMVSAAQRLQELKMSQAQAAAKHAEATYAGSKTLSIAAIVLGVVLGVLLGALLVQSMLRSLSAAIGVSERIAAGHATDAHAEQPFEHRPAA